MHRVTMVKDTNWFRKTGMEIIAFEWFTDEIAKRLRNELTGCKQRQMKSIHQNSSRAMPTPNRKCSPAKQRSRFAAQINT